VSGSAPHAAAPLAAGLYDGLRQRRLGLMECQPFGQNGVVTALETCDERRLRGNVLFSREVRRMTGAAQQPLHLARPFFLLDFVSNT